MQQQVGEAEQESMRVELDRVLASLASLAEPVAKSSELAMDPDLINEVLQTLAQQLAESDTAAQATIDSYHELLSTGNLGSICKELEKELGEYDFDAAQKTLLRMQAAVAEAVPSVEVGVDEEKLADVIQQLGSLIADFDTSAQVLLDSEEPLLLAAGLSLELKKMSMALDDYDFDTAMAFVREIAEARGIQL